jgi:hypothetical protein
MLNEVTDPRVGGEVVACDLQGGYLAVSRQDLGKYLLRQNV